jgi:peptidoglycan LD-endopeptidase CwlK
MAANLDLLISEFASKVRQLLANCAAKGIEMRPYYTLRTPFEQGILWRQSRSKEEITAKVAELKQKKAPFLAHCIENVGPQHGEHVTNAIPGLSWHQWGEAVDCFWVLNGKAEWSTQKLVNGLNGYRVYAQEAALLGLDAGMNWPRFKDAPHVQWRKGSPTAFYTLVNINKVMEERF